MKTKNALRHDSIPMLGYFLVTLLFFLAGLLSPLFTLAWLWQVKEWRWDRLLEHLKREGWLGQLFGRIRPAVVGLALLTYFLAQDDFKDVVLTVSLFTLTMISFAQVVLGKQRRPVPTQKAITLTGTAFVLTILLTLFVASHHPGWLPVIVLLQPLTLAIAWALWFPVDTFLKRRIITHTRALRKNHPDVTVIGVTGSVGKTTTKELLACVLKDLEPAVTPAYVNAEIGVARWMSAKLGGPRIPKTFIVELGAYRKGEIATLCTFVQPAIGVVTHVGDQHIALFGSQEKLFEAKSELITSLPLTGRAFFNGDNELCRKMAAHSPCPIVIVGTGGQCDLEAFEIEETSRGIRFRARDTLFDVPLHGTHNVTNVLLAIAVGEHLGVRFPRMQELLREFTPLSKTFAVREEHGVRILDDTHNSSVASMKAAIAWARSQPEQRKILLAAGLIEMGERQTPSELELGALAGGVFERTIVLDDTSAKNFVAGGAKNVEVFSKQSLPVSSGSLLICTGRMSGNTIKKLLPS